MLDFLFIQHRFSLESELEKLDEKFDEGAITDKQYDYEMFSVESKLKALDQLKKDYDSVIERCEKDGDIIGRAGSVVMIMTPDKDIEIWNNGNRTRVVVEPTVQDVLNLKRLFGMS